MTSHPQALDEVRKALDELVLRYRELCDIEAPHTDTWLLEAVSTTNTILAHVEALQKDAERWRHVKPLLRRVQWTGGGYEYTLYLMNEKRLQDINAMTDAAIKGAETP